VNVGDALRYVLVRPGRVVVRPVVGQDGAQVSLAEDQHAVQEFTAQGSDKAFAGGVHTWSLDRGAQDPGASGPEDWPSSAWQRACPLTVAAVPSTGFNQH
jgi:hypothetical protein